MPTAALLSAAQKKKNYKKHCSPQAAQPVEILTITHCTMCPAIVGCKDFDIPQILWNFFFFFRNN